MQKRSFSTHRVIMQALLFGASWSSASGQTGNPGGTFTLNAAQVDFARLAADAMSADVAFTVDVATQVSVKISTLLDGLASSITGPGGQVLNEQTIASFGGDFCTFDGEQTPTGYVFTMINEPGFHHLFQFPSLGAGTYTVHLGATLPPAQDRAVLIELSTDSPVGVALLATESVLVQGSLGVLVGAAFEGTTPVANAAVSVWLKTPSGTQTIGLLDSGVDADQAMGDGLYSGLFAATVPGEYIAVADLTGLTGTGVPFARVASASVRVVSPSAAFTGATFIDQGVDINANGKFNRLRISAPVTVSIAGDYIFTVVLETALGAELAAYGYATLGIGAQTIPAHIVAPAILAVGENGPYTIREAELLYVGDEGAVPADRIVNGTQVTQAWQLSQFEQPPIALTGVTSDFGIDTNANGLFDWLQVDRQLIVQVAGQYYYAVSLENECGAAIELLSGSQMFAAGTPQNLLLKFQGARIGARGIDGPYAVRDFLIGGPAGSATVSQAADTQAYSHGQFEAYAPAPDCNANGIPDACDIAAGTSQDQECGANGIPDECDADCDNDGVPDSCEIAQGAVDCNLNGVPDECDIAAGEPDCDGDGVPNDCDDVPSVEVHLLVVKDQSVIPGDASRTVQSIENLSVNSNGQWLVEVTLSGDASDASTILTGLMFCAPSVFLREGQGLGSPPGATINSFDDFNLNNNGNFGGNLSLRGLPSNQDTGVYFNSNIVIQESQLGGVPPFEPGSPYIGFLGAQINGADQIAMMASMDIPSVPTTIDRAIVRVDNPGGVPTQTLIAKEGDELLPTRFVSDFGTGPHEWSLNNNGDVTYFADLTGDTATDGTIWRNATLLAQEGSPSPVSGRNWLTLTFANTHNNVGDYAFLGRLTGDLASDVLLVKNGAKYLQEGDPAPGLPGFVITGFFTVGGGPIRMSDSGDILHFLDWDDPDTTKDTGLFLGNTMLLQEGVSQIDGRPVRVINNGPDAFAMSSNGEWIILECSVYYTGEDVVREAAALIRIMPPFCLGDADCDGDIDFFDIDPFVAKLGCPATDPTGCSAGCPWQNSDMDQDCDVDFFDLDPFVARLGQSCDAGSAAALELPLVPTVVLLHFGDPPEEEFPGPPASDAQALAALLEAAVSPANSDTLLAAVTALASNPPAGSTIPWEQVLEEMTE